MTTTKRFIETETTLAPEYQLPHPSDLSDSPIEQQASLEKKGVRILRELCRRASIARERLDDAKQQSESVWMGKVDQMISLGQLPPIPGVIKDTAYSATTLNEKTNQYAEQGLQLIKITVTPTGAGTNSTTLIYLDPKVTTIEAVKAQMLEKVKEGAESLVKTQQANFDLVKADIEKFHKHYVLRQKQVTSVADLFKAAKEI